MLDTTLPLPRLFFAFLPCLALPGLHAQTLVGSDVLYPEGPSYRMEAITDLFPWDTLAGTNVTWDYDWITVDTADDQRFQWIFPALGQGAAGYPNTNYAVRSIGGINDDYIIDTYYLQTDNSLLELGSVGPVLTYVFETPGLCYAFPAAVGDTSSGEYCFNSDGLGIQYHFCGVNYVTHDAHGTLTLPYGTFADVKHVTQWRSSLETTGGGTDSSYSISQQWFVPGVPHPVLDVTLFIDQDGQLWPSGRMMDQGSVLALSEASARATWSVWPNPTTGTLTLSGLPTGTQRVELLTLDGRHLRDLPGNSSGPLRQVDVSDLSPGTYLVRFTAQHGQSTLRFVKQ